MLLNLQKEILERIATGEDLRSTLDLLCRKVEGMLSGTRCTVVAIDDDQRIRPLAAPAMPPAYNQAIDGLQIGPCAGSCGTAAWRRTPVIVEDIATDPLWEGYRKLALPMGLAACWSSPIPGERGEPIGCFAFYYDVPRGPSPFEQDIVSTCLHLCTVAIERARHAEAMQALLYRDRLTGLGNRAAFEDALTHLPAEGWALLLIDVDDLKLVNDMFGHRAGDWMISTVALRVAGTVTTGEAYRIGGDELAVLLRAKNPAAEAERIGHALIAAVDRPADCAGQMLHPAISIGAAVSEAGSPLDIETARQQADFALYHAKATGKGGFVRHTPSLGTRIARRLAASRTARTSLARGVEPHYQPIVSLDTRAVVGLEALCRVRGRSGAFLTADLFQDALTDAHVAGEVTRAMLARVTADLRDWADAGVPLKPVAINLSPFDFRAPGIAQQVFDAIDMVGLPRACLSVEITETVYLGRRNDIVIAELNLLRASGVSVALDDFGTGFASLSHLLSTPVDVIKIDKSFVDDGPRGYAIIDGMMRIAAGLGIRVTAEGVEREDQARPLAELGCQTAQGYLFAKPMNGADASAYLSANAPVLMELLPPRMLRAV